MDQDCIRVNRGIELLDEIIDQIVVYDLKYCGLLMSSIGYRGDITILTQSEQLKFPLEGLVILNTGS